MAPFIKMLVDWVAFGVAATIFYLKRVVTAIVDFFGNGGIGKLWEAVKERFNTALVWLRDKLFSLWDTYIKPAWEWLKGVGVWIWNTFIKPAWEFLKNLVMGIWDNILKPAWERFKSIVMWIWESILKPAWDRFKAFISYIWNSILKPAWDWFKTKVYEIWNDIIKPVWNWLKEKFISIWNEYIKPSWTWLKTKFNDIWTTYLEPSWTKIQSHLNKVAEWLDRFQQSRSVLSRVNQASPGRIIGGLLSGGRDHSIPGGTNQDYINRGTDRFGNKIPGRAFGGIIPEDGLYKLHAGEQVGRGNTVSNSQNNNIVLNISGGGFDNNMLDKVVKGISNEMRTYGRW